MPSHRYRIFLVLSIFSFLFGSLAMPSLVAATSPLHLSLIQVGGERASDEFVELYNSGSDPVHLKDYSLRRKSQSDASAKGSSLKTFSGSDIIPAGGHFLWANGSGLFKDLADVTTSASLTDNNSLALIDKDGDVVDTLTWGSDHFLPFAPPSFANPEKSERFVRDPMTLAWSLSKTDLPTNSEGETFVEPTLDEPPPSPAGPNTVRINEVFPNPKEKGDLGEFIELYNFGSEAVDLSDWSLRDASVSGKYIFSKDQLLTPGSFRVITDSDFTLSLNNVKETLSLFDSAGTLIHSVSYEKTKEGVALNLVNEKLRGARRPTPGAVNAENTDPVTRERVPKKGFRDLPIEFRARGEDQDGDQLKFTWDFGDGHKSYKEKTSHKYAASGRYTVTLKTDDGLDLTEEVFEIKIEKYAPPKVRIVALLPNPAGKDTEHEWIEIENREKHPVNLRDFSIATGSKKKSITNHPIREDFVIPAKGSKRLSREHSLFTLGNERGYVELRAPDGKAIQSLKYKFDRSLKDNIVLKKEKGKRLAPITIETDENPEEKSLEIDSGTSPNAPAPLKETPATLPESVAPVEPLADPETENAPQVLGAMTEMTIQVPMPRPRWQAWIEHWNARLNTLFVRD